MPPELKTFDDYTHWIAALLRDDRVREEAVERGLLRPAMDERLLQCVWHELFFGADLKTASGKSLVIKNPGRWNTAAGPDFQSADLIIDGQPLSGDVEIHINAADWRRHRHHEDFAYNGVVLHAVLDNAGGPSFDTLQNGRRVERFEMMPHLFPDLETIRQTVNPDEYYPFAENVPRGVCHRVLATMDRRALDGFLLQAGRERLRDKVRRFEAQLGGETIEQVFYQALLTSLGHKGSKILLFLLSKRAPLAEVLGLLTGSDAAERARQAEAILLHVANLLPPPDSAEKGAGFDEETLAHLNQLNRCWAEASGYFSDRLIPPTRQWFSGMRPANFPPRRLAGVASHLARQYQGAGFLADLYAMFAQNAPLKLDEKAAKRFTAQLADRIAVPAAGYWAHRFTIGGKRTERAQPLIGGDRATSIVFNALLPIIHLRADHEGDKVVRKFVERLYDLFPPLADNAIVRFMRLRLFGENWQETAGQFGREFQNQALLKIFQDCCNNNDKTCAECLFFREDGTPRAR